MEAKLRRRNIPEDVLARCSVASKEALVRLSEYIPSGDGTLDPAVAAQIPAFRSAGVALPLFVGHNGRLYVLLTRRSKKLSSHGGDTALPGGRFELTDKSIEHTARREAEEEVGLPNDATRIPRLCQMESFLSANELAVTPTVMLMPDPDIPVTSIFATPLEAFLFHAPPPDLESAMHVTTPDRRAPTPLPGKKNADQTFPQPDPNESHWHSIYEVYWITERLRRHTFWDKRNPIRGLTSDILIRAAEIAYGKEPDYGVRAEKQPPQAKMLYHAFAGPERVRGYRVPPRIEPIDLEQEKARRARL